MSTATFELHTTAADDDIDTPKKGLVGKLWRAIDGIRQASAERGMRQQMAQLDHAILRDLGIATDEIPRIHAAEHFTPRTWIG